jgi:hypothetical protein
MPKANHESVRMLAIEIGAREAARKLGLNENTVLSWAKREKWQLPSSKPGPAAIEPHASPAETLIASHKEHETRTKSSLARATSRAAAEAEQLPQVLPHSGKLRDLAATAAGLFGWNQGGVTVNSQQTLVVTQEQLEQIRALRGT